MADGINIKNSLPVAPSRTVNDQDKQLKDASKMYEQYFLGEMVKAMRKTVSAGGVMKPSYAEKIYKNQLDSEYVKQWSQAGGVGLGDMIYNQIKEKYFPGGSGPAPKGVAPIKKNSNDFKEINVENFMELHKSSGARLQFRPEPGFRHLPEVVSPLDGTIEATYANRELGAHSIKMSHVGGFQSQLIFRGRGEALTPGMKVSSGELLGHLAPDDGVLDWRLSGLPRLG